MKMQLIQILLLLGLVSLPGLANADRRDTLQSGYIAISNIEWRLGTYAERYRGHDIHFRTPGSRRWQRAPGTAIAIADGWVLGTDYHYGGYGIYRWNGYDWSRMPGSAVRIGGSYQSPWVINDRNIRYVWNGYSWRESDKARYETNSHADKRNHKRHAKSRRPRR